MVDRKTVLIAACMVLLGGCGSQAGNAPVSAPKDAKTGKSFEDRNKMLEEVKAQRPFEYEVLFDVSKENPKAMDSYLDYNNKTEDRFEKPSYTDSEGRDVSKESFKELLSLNKLPMEYESVVLDYFVNNEKSQFEKSFSMIDPGSPFHLAAGMSLVSFSSNQNQARIQARVADIIPLDFKLVDQGGVLLLQVTFRTTGFWAPETLEGLPAEIEKEVLKTAPLNPQQYTKDNAQTATQPSSGMQKTAQKPDWSYHASGQIKLRLKPVNGKWLIHDQI